MLKIIKNTLVDNINNELELIYLKLELEIKNKEKWFQINIESVFDQNDSKIYYLKPIKLLKDYKIEMQIKHKNIYSIQKNKVLLKDKKIMQSLNSLNIEDLEEILHYLQVYKHFCKKEDCCFEYIEEYCITLSKQKRDYNDEILEYKILYKSLENLLPKYEKLLSMIHPKDDHEGFRWHISCKKGAEELIAHTFYSNTDLTLDLEVN
jgi:hypothetical protein